MADREAVLETLREQSKRFTHEKVVSSFKGWNRVMQYSFPDIGLLVTIPVKDGVPEKPVEGKAEAPQVSYEMSSETFLALSRKEMTGMKAYSQKLVKIKASMPDLLKLQKLDTL